MSLAEELALDLQDAVGGYESGFTWTDPAGGDPITIPCVRRDNPSALEILEAGGEVDLSVFALTVSRLDLSTLAPALLTRCASLAAIGDGINSNAAQIGWINGAKDPNSPRLTFLCKSYDSTHAGPGR